MENIQNTSMAFLQQNNLWDIFMNIGMAVLVLIIGTWLGKILKSRILSMGNKIDHFDPMLARFFGSVVQYAMFAITIIVVLGLFGIETTSFVALLGTAALAIGLALQGTLSNLAAGVMLILFRPFDIGHSIEAAGHAGTVRSVNLFTTELTTADNVLIIIQNNAIWSSSIVNYSANATRRVDLVFRVSYTSDLKKTEKILHQQMAADSRIQADPAPFAKVTNLGDSSVDFTMRIWCQAEHYWDLKCDMIRAVKEALEQEGIDISYPTRLFVNTTAQDTESSPLG